MCPPFNIALIGFGEAGKAFAEGWPQTFGNLYIYDIKCEYAAHKARLLEDANAFNGTQCDHLPDALVDADVIFSFVTADQAKVAAKNAAGCIKRGALFIDCNSCAPDTKRKSAPLIETAGGRYVDAAVMAPVHPMLHKTKLHVCGPHNQAVAHIGETLDMDITFMEGEIGTASATKMVRSIMMKGLEAVMMECVLAGRRAGVDELVLDSLEKTYPGFQFREKANYMMERVIVHGERRAAEMREVALTVSHLGLENSMSLATVEWQQKIGALHLDPNYALAPEDYQSRADIILALLEKD